MKEGERYTYTPIFFSYSSFSVRHLLPFFIFSSFFLASILLFSLRLFRPFFLSPIFPLCLFFERTLNKKSWKFWFCHIIFIFPHLSFIASKSLILIHLFILSKCLSYSSKNEFYSLFIFPITTNCQIREKNTSFPSSTKIARLGFKFLISFFVLLAIWYFFMKFDLKYVLTA